MTKTKKSVNIKNLYDDILSIYTLHKVEQESLYLCYEENKDYGHIFALDTIISDKFQKILKEFNKLISI